MGYDFMIEMKYVLYKEISAGYDPARTRIVLAITSRHLEEGVCLLEVTTGDDLSALLDKVEEKHVQIVAEDIITTLASPTKRIADGMIKVPLSSEELLQFDRKYQKVLANRINQSYVDHADYQMRKEKSERVAIGTMRGKKVL